jgi:apolipoprotein D and lipocalin family protein
MKIRIKFRLCYFFASVGLFIFVMSGCSSVPRKPSPELKVVPYVEVDRYLGKWYEIARYPHSFQEGCFGSTAFYEKLGDGNIKVTNQCRKGSPQGELDEAIGKATIADKSTNAKLKVQFFWPFNGNYWIIDLDKDYQYAVVSEPNRQYLWILSRSPKMAPKITDMLKEKIRGKGFDLAYLEITSK